MKFDIHAIMATTEEVVRERIQRLGVTQSGALEYYHSRLEQGNLFTDTEHVLAEWIHHNYSSEVTVFEVGAGIGTLALLLNSFGVRVVAMDSNNKRFNMSLAIQSALAKKLPGVEALYLPECTQLGKQTSIYQKKLPGPKVAVIGNLVSSWVEDNKAEIFAALSDFDELLFTPSKFGKSREESELDEVLGLLAGADVEACSIPGQPLPFYRVKNLASLRPEQVANARTEVVEKSLVGLSANYAATYRELLVLARDLYKASDYAAAIELLNTLLSQAKVGDPNHRDALFFLIKCQVALKKLTAEEVYPLTLLAASTYPDHKDFQMLHARSCRDSARVQEQFKYYKRVARLDVTNLEAIWGMASVLTAAKKFCVAAKLYDLVDLSACPYRQLPVEAAESYLMTEQLAKAKHAIDVAQNKTPNDSRVHLYDAVLAAKEAHSALPSPTMTARHIAICGPSYVGSTIFGVMLGGFENVENIGESNWLTRRKGSDDRSQMLNFDNDPENSIPYCKTHRRISHDCVEMSFRRELAADSTNYYDKIAAYLAAEILVTSEKTLSNYWVGDPLWRFDQVVLFKHPILQMQSALNNLNKKRKNAGQPLLDALNIDVQMTQWVRAYAGILGNMRPTGQRLVLNWERFCDAPHAHMRVICDRLGLTYRDDFLQHIPINHLFGGNEGINLDQILETGEIEIRKAKQPNFTDAEERQIISHVEGNRMFRRLQRLYEKDFRV